MLPDISSSQSGSLYHSRHLIFSFQAKFTTCGALASSLNGARYNESIAAVIQLYRAKDCANGENSKERRERLLRRRGA